MAYITNMYNVIIITFNNSGKILNEFQKVDSERRIALILRTLSFHSTILVVLLIIIGCRLENGLMHANKKKNVKNS